MLMSLKRTLFNKFGIVVPRVFKNNVLASLPTRKLVDKYPKKEQKIFVGIGKRTLRSPSDLLEEEPVGHNRSRNKLVSDTLLSGSPPTPQEGRRRVCL